MLEGSVGQKMVLHLNKVVGRLVVHKSLEFFAHQLVHVLRHREEFLDGGNCDMAFLELLGDSTHVSDSRLGQFR